MAEKRDDLGETIRSALREARQRLEIQDHPGIQLLQSRPELAELLEENLSRSRVLRAIYLHRTAAKRSTMGDAAFVARLAYGFGYDWAYRFGQRRHPEAPPRLAERLLSLLVPANILEEKLGDLEETYRAIALREGEAFATTWYWREALLCAVSAAARVGLFVARLAAIFRDFEPKA